MDGRINVDWEKLNGKNESDNQRGETRMPIRWRPNRKVSFNRWEDCPRCGLPWPVKAFRREPETSSLVCSECYDEVSHAYTKSQGELKESTGRQSSPWTPD